MTGWWQGSDEAPAPVVTRGGRWAAADLEAGDSAQAVELRLARPWSGRASTDGGRRRQG